MQSSPPLDVRGRTRVRRGVCVCLLRDQTTEISVSGKAKGSSFALLTQAELLLVSDNCGIFPSVSGLSFFPFCR